MKWPKEDFKFAPSTGTTIKDPRVLGAQHIYSRGRASAVYPRHSDYLWSTPTGCTGRRHSSPIGRRQWTNSFHQVTSCGGCGGRGGGGHYDRKTVVKIIGTICKNKTVLRVFRCVLARAEKQSAWPIPYDRQEEGQWRKVVTESSVGRGTTILNFDWRVVSFNRVSPCRGRSGRDARASKVLSQNRWRNW